VVVAAMCWTSSRMAFIRGLLLMMWLNASRLCNLLAQVDYLVTQGTLFEDALEDQGKPFEVKRFGEEVIGSSLPWPRQRRRYCRGPVMTTSSDGDALVLDFVDEFACRQGAASSGR